MGVTLTRDDAAELLARRARALLAIPDGIPPLILTYATAATGATA